MSENSPRNEESELSQVLKALSNINRKIESQEQSFDYMREEQRANMSESRLYQAATNKRFETLEFLRQESESLSQDARQQVRFTSASRSDGFSTPSGKPSSVKILSEQEQQDEQIDRLLMSPEVQRRMSELNGGKRRQSDAGLSQMASEQSRSTSMSSGYTSQNARPIQLSGNGDSSASNKVTHRTVQQIDFSHILKVAKIPQIEAWTKDADKYMTKFEEELPLRDYIDPALWNVVKLKVSDRYSESRLNQLSNVELLDSLRIHVQDEARTKEDFRNYMVSNVVAKPLNGSIECLSDFPVIVHEIQRFMAEAKKTYEYLADQNDEATPAMSGDDGLVKSFLIPGLVFGFGKHFADTVAKKDTVTANSFTAFAAHISAETSNLLAAAMAARQVEKLMKAVRKRNGSVLQQQQQSQQSAPRVGWQQSTLRTTADKHAEDMSNMEMELLAVEGDEPSPRACHHAVFYGTACHKADCRFDHTPPVVKRWRQHWFGRLEVLLGEYKRTPEPSKPSATTAQIPRPTPQFASGLHMIEDSDGMDEEGAAMFELHRQRQEHLQFDRNAVLDALLAVLPDSSLAQWANAHNTSVNPNHGVQQYKYSK